MQTSHLILIGLVVVFVWAARDQKNTRRPQWVEQLQGWQVIFGMAAFVVAFLMILNPEFLALGLVGDTAFFDLLVLALGLQFRGVALGAWGRVRLIFSRVRGYGIRAWHRDYAMVAVALGPICGAVLAFGKGVVKCLREHGHVIS